LFAVNITYTWRTGGDDKNDSVYDDLMIIKTSILITQRRDTSVVIVTGYGWTAGVRFLSGSRFFSSSQRPDRIWGTPSILSNVYRRLFPRGLRDRGVKVTTHLDLLPRSEMVELYLHLPIFLHDIVLN
jgi:hypothetical protein